MQAFFFSATWGNGWAISGKYPYLHHPPQKKYSPAFFKPEQISGVVKARIHFQCPASVPPDNSVA
jgi:hypothetical protein